MKSKKLFLSALALAIAIPAFVQTVEVAAATNSFKDVPAKYWANDIIHEMRDQKIVAGYEDGTFRPNEVISRKHAAVLISRAKNLPTVKPFIAFKDVSEKNAYYSDIKKLQQAGIFAPDNQGNYNPNQPITRAEMAKVLAIAFDLDVKATNDFPDVPVGHPANEYVRAIYSNGITTGDNGLFNPNDSLTRAHYAVFMHRAMNLDENHVSKPIEKPANPITPTPKPDTKTGLITDKYDHFMDVPRPQGYEPAKQRDSQQKKQAEIRVKEVHNWTGAFSIMGWGTEERLNNYSKEFGITVEELVSIINWTIETGDVHDGGHFSLYYDFNKGSEVTSGRR